MPDIDRRKTLIGLAGLAGFFLLSALSQAVPLMLHLMVIYGIAFPLAWGRWTGSWEQMGFTRRGIGRALLWGVGAGAAASLLGLVVAQGSTPPSDLGLELAVSLALWILLASPFQEFFFRGWLQGLLQSRLGAIAALLLTSLVFTAWHYVWPLASGSAIPLWTIQGLLSTLLAGLIYGLSFQQSGCILAPWLAHAITGVAFAAMGAGSFIAAWT